jgi:uncharacterized protein
LAHKIRAVIDTNLFVSGIFGKNSLTSTLQDLWIDQEIELATSLEIMKEVSRVLTYPKIRQKIGITDEGVRQFFRLVFRKALITKDIYKSDRIISDPTDNKFFACAMETKADYIVSGDNHLLELKHYHGIQIVDAKTFVKIVKGK